MVTVQIEMKGIHGHLHYRSGSDGYRIPIEHTGDYKRGLLVFLADIAPSIPDQEKMHVLSQIAITPAQFRRTAELDGHGVVTVKGLLHYLCSHDQQHLAGLQWLQGKIETARL